MILNHLLVQFSYIITNTHFKLIGMYFFSFSLFVYIFFENFNLYYKILELNKCIEKIIFLLKINIRKTI